MTDQSQVEVTNKSFQTADGAVVHEREVVKRDTAAGPAGVAENIVYLVYGLLASLLALRIVLTMLIANKANTFADMIYTLTAPFVAPFRSLFGVDTRIGESGSRFELETLLAIIAYGLLAWLLVSIITIRKRAAN